MDAEIKHHMKINGIVPNVLVLPPKAGIYVSMVPPRETEFHLRGPGAHEALTQDRTGISTFRGNKVFEAQSFDVDFQHEFIDLTSRPRMCGEYFVIPGSQAPHNLMATLNAAVGALVEKPIEDTLAQLNGGDFVGLLENARHDPFIHIYSADKDDYVKITYSEASTQALNGEDPNGRSQRLADMKKRLNGLHSTFSEMGKKAVAAKKTPREKKEEAARWSARLLDSRNFDTTFSTPVSETALLIKLQTIEDELEEDSFNSRDVGAQIKEADLLIHHRHFTQTADADKHHYDILLLRPFQTYTMHSAIMAKGGSDLGNTYHGHHDFQLSDNVAVKTHFGNYTFYSKCVVKRPRNYTIIPDCFAQGYISGEGHTFFKPPPGRTRGRFTDTPGDLGKAVQEGTLGSSDCRQSLIAWKIPRGDGEKLEDAIDITGRFAGAHRDYEPSDELHFEGADALGSLEYIDELDQNRGDEAYLHQVQQVNTVCFRGAQYTNGTFTHQGKGHWGTPYAGVLPVRDGAIMYMDPNKEPKKGDQVV